MFKSGFSSKLLQGFPLDQIMRKGADIGYQCVEIWMHQVWESRMSPKEIRDLAEKLGLVLQIHMDTGDINLISNNEAIRETSLSETLRAIEFAAEVSAQVVTVHPGRKTSAKDSTDMQELMERQVTAIRRLSDYAEEHQLIIGLENMEVRPLEFICEEEKLAQIGASIPRLQYTLDIAHLHSLGNVPELVRKWSLPIANVHISQASEQMHLPLFSQEEGTIDYDQVFPLLAPKYDGCVIVEGYIRGREEENLLRSFEWLKKYCGEC